MYHYYYLSQKFLVCQSNTKKFDDDDEQVPYTATGDRPHHSNSIQNSIYIKLFTFFVLPSSDEQANKGNEHTPPEPLPPPSCLK